MVSAPAALRASSNFSRSAREISCSVLRNQIMNSRSLSCGLLPFSWSFRTSSIWAFVCFMIFSSIWKKLSSCRFLIPVNSPARMLMCISSTAFRSRSSGKSVIAAFKCCAEALVSFCRSSIDDAPVFFVISFASSLYRINSASISSATCGNGTPAFLAQKKSLAVKSYAFLDVPLAGLFSSIGVSTVIRLSFMFKTS